jgi:hypothetical protein
MNSLLTLLLILVVILGTSAMWPPQPVTYTPTAQLSYAF